MKKYLVLGVLIIMIVAVALPVWSERVSKTDPEQENEYSFFKKDGREQILGGKSDHAGNGLARAMTRARSMQCQSPPEDPKGDGGAGTERKKK